MTSVTRREIVIAMLLAAAGPIPVRLGAQALSGDTSMAHACAKAVTALDRGQSREATYQAIGQLQTCPNAGGHLASQWRKPKTDTVAMRLLGQVSGRVSDQRLFEVVQQTALDVSRPRELRREAIRALV